jgi:hypothetical protein
MEMASDSEGHSHVAVFYGPRGRYSPGLVLLQVSGGAWQVSDETGQVGPPETVYGTWPSETDAYREALRLLRSRFGEGTVPCWVAGGSNRALVELGYTRGRVGWRWWPPGLTRRGESQVGPDGMPAQSGASAK